MLSLTLLIWDYKALSKVSFITGGPQTRIFLISFGLFRYSSFSMNEASQRAALIFSFENRWNNSKFLSCLRLQNASRAVRSSMPSDSSLD